MLRNGSRQAHGRNRSGRTAAAVEVEAILEVPGEKPIVSTAMLDYVPGHSSSKGGLFLSQDPRAGRFSLRALGYKDP